MLVARKWTEADGLVVTGHEAAAHGAEVGTLVLIPSIARQTKLPIIAAGGFSDGRGLAAALVLGAEGISMGTPVHVDPGMRNAPEGERTFP